MSLFTLRLYASGGREPRPRPPEAYNLKEGNRVDADSSRLARAVRIVRPVYYLPAGLAAGFAAGLAAGASAGAAWADSSIIFFQTSLALASTASEMSSLES